jgi:hypothetical protein
VENHYCSVCLETQRFLPTDRIISFRGFFYRVILCQECNHDLWRLVDDQGRPIREATDAA